MRPPRDRLWPTWVVMIALLALCAVLPFVIPPRERPTLQAWTSVLTFVVSLLAMTAAVGSLATRESLVRAIASRALDLQTPAHATRVLRTLVASWALCLVVGGLGTFLAWSAAKPKLAWPYLLVAATLLVFHAPRAAVFDAER